MNRLRDESRWSSEGLVSGEVTRLISDAETYRRRVRDRAQADVTRFRSKLRAVRATGAC